MTFKREKKLKVSALALDVRTNPYQKETIAINANQNSIEKRIH